MATNSASTTTKKPIHSYQLSLTSMQAQFLAMCMAAGPNPSVSTLLITATLARKLGEDGYENLRRQLMRTLDEIRANDDV